MLGMSLVSLRCDSRYFDGIAALDAHGLPRRREALERAGADVPPVQRRRVTAQRGAAAGDLDVLSGHAKLGRREQRARRSHHGVRPAASCQRATYAPVRSLRAVFSLVM